jgi:assimilatory nitrate reductase catalytic subunit
VYRAAHLQGGRLEACVFICAHAQLPSRSWLATLFESARLGPAERASLLSGQPRDPLADVGDTVCSCFRVGRRTLDAAVAQGCRDVSALGKRTRAGTQCGSCIPELRRIAAAANG